MPVTVRATDILFNNGTTQNTAGLTSAVTSAVAGNGIGVSGPTGAVTFSIAAPGFNTVGSYAQAFISAGTGQTISTGSTYSAGDGNLQVQNSGFINTGGGFGASTATGLSGTWRWMGVGGTASGAFGSFIQSLAIAVRVS